MSIKTFVNNNKEWEAFCDHIRENYLGVAMKQIKQDTDPHIIYRRQGEIKAYEAMLQLRDAVNGRSK